MKKQIDMDVRQKVEVNGKRQEYERNSMKIAVVGENLNSPSGFGRQMNTIVRGLSEYNHSVHVVVPATYQKCDDLSENVCEWRVVNFSDVNEIDRVLHKIKPEVVIVYSYLYSVASLSRMNSAPRNCPVYFWMLWEGSSLPPDAANLFYNLPKNSVIHGSNYAKELWKDVIDSDLMFPHSVDLDVFNFDISWLNLEKKKELRRKWGEILRFPLFEDSLVILNVDRNTKRKRWDATFDYVRKLQERVDRHVQLIAHTKKIGETIPNSEIIGYDLEKLAKIYGVEKQIAYTDFDWNRGLSNDDLIELYRICDFRVSTSAGEGFGLPTLECGALGVPQIVNKNTSLSEILEDSDFLVESAMFEEHRGVFWDAPNVNGMVDRTCELLNDCERVDYNLTYVRKIVEEDYDSKKVIKRLNDLIDTTEKNGCWYNYHWGYTREASQKMFCSNLVNVIFDIMGPIEVLEIGSFDGMFIDYAIDRGLKVTGIEPDSEIVSRLSEKIRVHIDEEPYLSDWPKAEAVVMTNRLESIYKNGGDDIVDIVIDRICSFDWAFLKLDPLYVWDVPEIPAKKIEFTLEHYGLKRCHHLEVLAKQKYKIFEHEIWSRVADTGSIPKALMR